MKLKPVVESGWVLMNPAGNIVPITFDANRWTAWCLSFDYLSKRLGEDWREKFWHLADASEKDAGKRGWKLIRCKRCTRQEFSFQKAKK